MVHAHVRLGFLGSPAIPLACDRRFVPLDCSTRPRRRGRGRVKLRSESTVRVTRRTIAILIVLTAAGLILGQSPPGPPPAPRAVADQLEHDFGTYDDRAPLFHVFSLWNVGNAALEVREVKASCGCTVPGDWARLVEPGGYWELPVSFNPSGRSGPQNQTIEVRTNDPENPMITFLIKGILAPRFLLNPPARRLTVGPIHPITNQPGRAPFTLEITVNTDLPVSLGPVELTPPIMNVCFDRVVDAGTGAETGATQTGTSRGDVYELELSFMAEMEHGVHPVKVNIPTGLSEEPEIEVDVAVSVAPRVTLNPTHMRLPESRTSPIRRAFVLENLGATPVEMVKVESECAGIGHEVETLAPGRKFRIWVTVPAHAALAGDGCELRAIARDVREDRTRLFEATAAIIAQPPRPRADVSTSRPGS